MCFCIISHKKAYIVWKEIKYDKMFLSDSEILDLRILNEVKDSDSVSGQYLKLIVKAKINLLVRSK